MLKKIALFLPFLPLLKYVKVTSHQTRINRRRRHAINTGPLTNGHLIWPAGHPFWQSTGTEVSDPFWWRKEIEICQNVNQWGYLWFCFWSGLPKFDPGHLKLSITGLHGPPTFKTQRHSFLVCSWVLNNFQSFTENNGNHYEISGFPQCE